ncbi:hypothetical protein K457DRAFT_124113 [Linnemannia elongata AG-77]|uniref:Uncharacterized protein n=1 Tax=Linnemannia elongata AG-77 TaxID=1314771 RepID=A0A197K451_9FUNG|nr:hypothetical protein K457DRAFT_124113 [Linnemannia elongata AG-77]
MAHPLSLFFSSSLSTSLFPPKGSFSCLFITSSSFLHLTEFHFNLVPIRQQRSFLIPAREPTRKHNNDNYNNHNHNHRDLKLLASNLAFVCLSEKSAHSPRAYNNELLMSSKESHLAPLGPSPHNNRSGTNSAFAGSGGAAKKAVELSSTRNDRVIGHEVGDADNEAASSQPFEPQGQVTPEFQT